MIIYPQYAGASALIAGGRKAPAIPAPAGIQLDDIDIVVATYGEAVTSFPSIPGWNTLKYGSSSIYAGFAIFTYKYDGIYSGTVSPPVFGTANYGQRFIIRNASRNNPAYVMSEKKFSAGSTTPTHYYSTGINEERGFFYLLLNSNSVTPTGLTSVLQSSYFNLLAANSAPPLSLSATCYYDATGLVLSFYGLYSNEYDLRPSLPKLTWNTTSTHEKIYTYNYTGSFSLELLESLTFTYNKQEEIPDRFHALSPIYLLSSMAVTAVKQEAADDREVVVPDLPSTSSLLVDVNKGMGHALPTLLNTTSFGLGYTRFTSEGWAVAMASGVLSHGKKGQTLALAFEHPSGVLAGGQKGLALAYAWPLASEFLAPGLKGSAAEQHWPHVVSIVFEYDMDFSGWVLQNVSSLVMAGFKGSRPFPAAAWPHLSSLVASMQKDLALPHNFDTASALALLSTKATEEGFVLACEGAFDLDSLAARSFAFSEELVFLGQIVNGKFMPFRKTGKYIAVMPAFKANCAAKGKI